MLVKNWRDVLRRAWSIRLMIIAGLLSGLEVALPLIDGYAEIPRGIFAALSGLTVAAAFLVGTCGMWVSDALLDRLVRWIKNYGVKP